MTLADKLKSISEKSSERIPDEARKVMHKATEDLRNSSIVNNVIKVGDKLPSFTMLNQKGIPVSSHSLLASGPLVLTVFRGSW